MEDRGGRKSRREGRQGEMGRKWRWRKDPVERGKEGWGEGAEKEERKVEREDFEFSPRNGGSVPLPHTALKKGRLATKGSRGPRQGRGAQAGRRLLTAPRPAPSGSRSSTARPTPPPASERSPPRPRPQTNYASENYRARPKGSRPRPCHPLPPYINPGCTMGPRMTDVCANNLRGSLADKRS